VADASGTERRAGPRELGVRIGDYEPGPANAITDVRGVAVGHVTVVRDEPAPPAGRGVARTGVTVVVPGPPSSLLGAPVAAGAAVLNGAGEMTGFLQVSEWGILETPVYLTATMAVGRVFDGAVAAAAAADPAVGAEDVVIPVVAECDDSWLSDVVPVQVDAADAGRALADAVAAGTGAPVVAGAGAPVAAGAGAPVAQGAVGAGTGMVCFDWKGGIGTSSRIVPELGATVGVLVLANFGAWRELRVDGVPVGRALGAPDAARSAPAGSCIVVVATDAPLGAAQLARVARRAGLGLARTGSVAHHGSGEIFLAFAAGRGGAAAAGPGGGTPVARAPAAPRAGTPVAPAPTAPGADTPFAPAAAALGAGTPVAPAPAAATAGAPPPVPATPDRALDPIFACTVEATEEAVLNALWFAHDVRGRAGRLVRALPHDDVLALLAAHGRLER
jgi:D-aminopeptidase